MKGHKQTISVEKIVAAGNDFVFVLSGRDAPVSWVPSRPQVRSLCDRHFGIGADGFVLMRELADDKYEWLFFNSDGSYAAMCGNAARAAACFIGQATGLVELKTGFGAVKLQALTPDKFCVEIDYSKSSLKETRIEVSLPGTEAGAFIGSPVLIDTGVPHVVIETTRDVLSLKNSSMDRTLAAPFRWPKEAGQAGANVTFFRRKNGSAIDAVTFERGVEEYTLSCGTGVLAAAVVASGSLKSDTGLQEIEVQNPGGRLNVSSKNFPKSLLLTGPAQLVFRAEVEIDISGEIEAEHEE